MKKLNQLLALASVTLALGLSSGNLAAQQPPGGGNFDPQRLRQQIQQRIMDYFREQLVVTNDDEWNVIEGRLSKVVQGRIEDLLSSMGFGGRSFGGNNPGGGRGGFLGFGQPSPEMEAIQKAVEDNAPTDQ